MARKDDRGTHNDPAWQGGNLTGGNDSGTATLDSRRLDRPDGPDLTARLLEESGASAAGEQATPPEPQPDPDDWPGTRLPPNRGGEEVTDESGRIASVEPLGGSNGNNA